MEFPARGILGFGVGCVVAAAGTSALWWVLGSGGPESGRALITEAETAGSEEGRGPAEVRTGEEAGAQGVVGESPQPDVAASPGPFGEEYWRWTDTEILEGWASVCEHTMPVELLARARETSHGQVLGAPGDAGRRLAVQTLEERRLLRLADSSDSAELLEAFEVLRSRNQPPPLEILELERLTSLLAPRSAGGLLHGPDLGANPDERVEQGVVLSFPPGIHRLRGLMSKKNPFPRDVTLRGAGMDVTLIVLDELSSRSTVVNFAMQDCTILVNDYLFDQRGDDGLAVRLSRVRLIGFDIGAGSSCAFGTEATLLHATDSRFEGGYGRAPGHGKLFDVRHAALAARFDRCQFSRIGLGRRGYGGTVLFQDCELLEMLDDPRQQDVVLEGCTVTLYERPSGESSRDLLARDLRDLFREWDPDRFR